jgi:Flp pilus assembly pilin Flp
MQGLRTLVSQFRRDERGVFAVLFGLMAIVLVALGGAVVDYVSLEQARSRAQIALDAAALALQPEIFKPGYDEEHVRELAEAMMVERIGDPRIIASIDQVTTVVQEGSLFFRASVRVPTTFVALVGVEELPAQLQTEATRKKLELEVVMVLDNSASMQNESRMTRLVDAAKCATYILMYSKVQDAPGNNQTCVPTGNATLVEDVRVGIVPFTMFVNVGAANANASWIDKTGASSIHFDNFDNDDDENSLVLSAANYSFPTRQTLFAATGEAWRGCVEARPHTKSGTPASAYLDTDDTPPTGGDTLFVPLFSPDMPDNIGGKSYISDSPAVCDRPATQGARCDFTEQRIKNWQGNWETPTIISSNPTGGSVNFTSSSLYPNAYYGARPPGCSCRNPTYSNWSSGQSTQTRNGWCTGSYVPTGLSNREYQERVCKYYAGVSGSGFSSGPNSDCTRTPILPLTATPATVITTIGNMRAEGGTNIHEGTAWGLRVLSPGVPFTEGGPYDEAISKVMIIMTDGENTDYNLPGHCNQTVRDLNGKCYPTAYGFPYNSRNSNAHSTSGGNIERQGPLGATNAQLVDQMNKRTAETCANAKAAGITVYTIGLATDKVTQSTPEVVRTMLTECATTPDRAHFPAQSSDLKATFADIADDLSALRLAQ